MGASPTSTNTGWCRRVIYLVTFFLTFWPASLLAGLAAPAVFANRHAPPTRFLLAWLVPAWLLFELILAKLPHFLLPLYPAIAILIAGCIETFQLSRRRWMEYGTFWFFAVPVLLAVGAVVMLIRSEGSLGFFAWPFAVAALIFGFRAWWLYDADGPERSLLRACAASILLCDRALFLRGPRTDLEFSERAACARHAQPALR